MNLISVISQQTHLSYDTVIFSFTTFDKRIVTPPLSSTSYFLKQMQVQQ